MSECAEYRAIAIAHARLALMTQSDELCETHVRTAASFLALAGKHAMRDLTARRSHWRASACGEPHLGRPVLTPYHLIGR
jgi:hypothetical protein